MNCKRIGEELGDSASHPCLPSSCVLTRLEARLQIHIRSHQMWVSGAASASSSSTSPFVCAPVDWLTGIISLGCPGDLRDIFPGRSSLNQRVTSSLMCLPAPQEGAQLKGVLVRRMFKGKEVLKRNRLSRVNHRRLSFCQKRLIVQSVGSSAHLWESHILYSAGGQFEILSRQNNVQLNEWFSCTSTICCQFYCKRCIF